MKKTYQKPEIYIENFNLFQSIASACDAADAIVGEFLPDDTPNFRIIHRDGRTCIAYNTVDNVMYTLICDGYGEIKHTEIMLNPDGSQMVWAETAIEATNTSEKLFSEES